MGACVIYLYLKGGECNFPFFNVNVYPVLLISSNYSVFLICCECSFKQVIKEDMKRALKNSNMKPLSHSSYLRLQVLCESFYDVDEKLQYLNDLLLDDLKAFIPELRSQV